MELNDNGLQSLHKEIDIIQDAIKRMSTNSFISKGWFITIIVLIVTVYIKFRSDELLLIPVLPAILFWYLDSYFLQLERLFRLKYDWVIKKRLMGDESNLYDLNPYNHNMWLENVVQKPKVVLFSRTIWPFYLLPLLLFLLLHAYLKTF